MNRLRQLDQSLLFLSAQLLEQIHHFWIQLSPLLNLALQLGTQPNQESRHQSNQSFASLALIRIHLRINTWRQLSTVEFLRHSFGPFVVKGQRQKLFLANDIPLNV